ncbi:RAMP superfamily CRISPR-associated protein [Alienimonas californiensis]|uniref:CRISPR type III-associated protein domain-containing protein n=1 Tax=Alienimonas californiensis TaxID=2527989 RepID=A0A517P6R1_9PLAN|nr:RAMP superfamily CRISPR-associated protein [Alienimonas californiensis]QDT15051.1 hypothetical protein CA12_11310 [Alienimonas californiensis]
MKWVRLELELITPCFLGGAAGDRTTAADLKNELLRPASLIGQWRYWLRTLHVDGLADDWRQRERELFGAASGSAGATQGRVWVRPVAGREPETIPASREEGRQSDHLLHRPPLELQYLLGQGLWDRKEGLTRPAFREGQRLLVDVAVRPTRGQSPEDRARDFKHLRHALTLWHTFGGLGARSRRGWGSVQVVNLDAAAVPDVPATSGEKPERWFWENEFRGLRPAEQWRDLARGRTVAWGGRTSAPDGMLSPSGTDCHPGDPRTADLAGDGDFSRLDRCCVVTPPFSGRSWDDVLVRISEVMKAVRADPDFRLPGGEYYSGETPPPRAAFGLPHNYFFKNSGGKVDIDGAAAGATRRASPVLLHVARVNDRHGPFVPAVLWLKAPLAPAGMSWKSKAGRGRVGAPDWEAVRRFLLAAADPTTVSSAPRR